MATGSLQTLLADQVATAQTGREGYSTISLYTSLAVTFNQSCCIGFCKYTLLSPAAF